MPPNCLPDCNDPSQRIVGFSAEYVLNGPYSGRVVFADPCCLDDPNCNEICTPIQVAIDSSADTMCCDVNTDLEDFVTNCWTEKPFWINGLMRSYGSPDNNTEVSVVSYFDYLNSKPINTEQFNGTDLQTVFDTIFQFYSGTPAALRCVNSFTNNKIKGPVEGNNTWAELQALAQAGYANLFVQVGGCLTIEEWKDHNSPVELVVPPEFILSSNKAEFGFVNTTIIRARGASLPKSDCGEQVLTTDSEGNPGRTTKCVISGVPSTSVNITVNNTVGEKEDILNGQVVSQFGCFGSKGINSKNGSFSGEYAVIDLNNPACQDASKLPALVPDCPAIYSQVQNGDQSCIKVITSTPSCVDVLVKGSVKSQVDEGLYGSYYGPNGGGGYGANSPNFFNWFSSITNGLFPVPYSALGFGAYGSKTFTSGGEDDSELYADQPSLQQCETVISTGIISDCGVSQDSIQNKYVPCKEGLFNLGIRRYQEIQLAANTWNVEVPYTPCFKLNQVIEFTTRETEDCAPETIKGLIQGLSIDKTDPECTIMRLSVSDLGCLGQTEYISGNLVQSPCAGEDNGDLNPWQISALGIEGQATLQGGCLILAAWGNGQSDAYYTHPEMTIGCEYEWSFDYETLAGGAVVFSNFPITAGTGSANLVGTGTESGSFIASATTGTWNFILFTPAVPTQMKITNFTIRKKVIA